jgi:hypothetical protein
VRLDGLKLVVRDLKQDGVLHGLPGSSSLGYILDLWICAHTPEMSARARGNLMISLYALSSDLVENLA